MKILKQHLEENNINLSNDDRFKLGKYIASIFDDERQGTHYKIKEDEYYVMHYEDSFLEQKHITKFIIKFIKKL